MDTFILKIYRGLPGNQYWEEFELEQRPGLNIISALMQIQKNPVNRKGERVAPVAWEQGCLEEICGSCSMLINARPRQACSALIAPLTASSRTITLAPFTKFPLIKDLVVDRQSLFDSLKLIEAWTESDASCNIRPEVQETLYLLSSCMSCGCCSEACPQVHSHSKFIGPAPISQVRLFTIHSSDKSLRLKRLNVLAQEGGIGGCGKAQACAEVCPKRIPLTESIALMGRSVVQSWLSRLFKTFGVG